MRRRHRFAVKPNRTVSLFGAVLMLGMFLFGFFFLTQVVLPRNPRPVVTSNGKPANPELIRGLERELNGGRPLVPPTEPVEKFPVYFLLFWLTVVGAAVLKHLWDASHREPTPLDSFDVIHSVEEVNGDSDEGPRPSGLADRLRELKRLREEDLITDGEYQERRKEILDRLA